MAATSGCLLDVQNLSASYGQVHALKPTSLTIAEGELVTVLGPNGAGKSTMLRAMTQLIHSTGQIHFKGVDITAYPTHARAKAGLIMVQEGRGLFGQMSVEENLLLGAYTADHQEGLQQRLQDVYPVSYTHLRAHET